MRVSVFSLLFMGCIMMSAQDCLPGWSYYRPLAIDNTNGESMTDCQIRIEVPTGALVSEGKLQASGADLRFTDANCNLIHYYMDSLATDSINGIWLKIPQIPANDSLHLQMYYGNATAESFANGDSTFIFFDDFSADSVNMDKWEPIGGYATLEVEEGILSYASNGMNPGPRYKFVRSSIVFTEAVNFDLNARVTNSNGFGLSSTDSTIHRILFRQQVSNFGFDTLAQVAWMDDTLDNGVQIDGMFPVVRMPRFEHRNMTFRAGIEDSLLTVNYFANLDEDHHSDSVFQVISEPMSGFHFILSTFLQGQTIYLDYIRVRKICNDSLSHQVGDESMLAADAIERPLLQDIVTLHPNPASTSIWLEGLPKGSYQLQLINSQGAVVMDLDQVVYGVESLQISLPELTNGLYWFRISSAHHLLFSQSIIIHR